MKKHLIISIFLLAFVTLCFCLTACTGADDTYYAVKGASLDESSWIKLGGGKWTDDDGESGKYKLDGDKITILQDGEEVMTGTLKDGTLTLELWGMPAGTYRTKAAQESLSVEKNAGNGTSSGDNGSSVNGEQRSGPEQGGTGSSSGSGAGEGILSEEEDDSAKVKSIEGGSVNGMTISMEVSENIDFVDLSGKITVSKNSSWQLYEDMTGQRLIPTKYATNLCGGNNLFYIVVNSSDNKVNRTYTLNIWKNYRVTISYYVLGELYDSEQVMTHTYLSDHSAPTVSGYTFNEWSARGAYVTEPMRVIASMTANVYAVSLDAAGGSLPSSSESIEVTYDQNYSLPMPARTGYTFDGWCSGSVPMTNERGVSLSAWKYAAPKTLTAKWIVNRYTLLTDVNNEKAGTVSKGGTYDYGSSISLTARTNEGYTWVGWFDGDKKLTNDSSLTYTFDMPAHDVAYTAKWIVCPLTLEKNMEEAGNISGLEGATVGQSITLSAIPNIGYVFLGWYDEDYKVSEENSFDYTFMLSEEIKTYTAKFSLCEEHDLDGDCVCKKCRTVAHGVAEAGKYCRHGDSVYFGSYPQSKVTEDATINALNSINESWSFYDYARKITTSRWNGQTYQTYYESDSTFMKYKDVTYNGEKYRAVYFNAYRPSLTGDFGTAEYSSQDNYGYYTHTIYWFKYEPIKWRILSEENGEALVLCEMIMDSREYAYGDNRDNYVNSTIRNWLNETFYSTAFNDLQKELILLTVVDNSARSTNPNNNATQWNDGENAWACEDTNDKVFLLSVQELTNKEYGFSESYENLDVFRKKESTDYAQCQGSSNNWWSRSMSYEGRVCLIIGNGAERSGSARYTTTGVVPALRIRL